MVILNEMKLTEIEEDPPMQKEFIDGEVDFKKRNEWFGNDQAMTATVMMAAKEMGGNMSAPEYYAALEKVAKAHYPEEFKNENRTRLSVAGDSPSGSHKKSKGFDSLPSEAKDAYEEISFYSQISKEDYAKSLNEQELL